MDNYYTPHTATGRDVDRGRGWGRDGDGDGDRWWDALEAAWTGKQIDNQASYRELTN